MKILNQEMALRRLLNKVELYNRICNMYLDTIDAELDKLIHALKNETKTVIAKQAHALKGRTLEIGAEKFASELKAIELNAKQDQILKVNVLIPILEQDKTQVVDALSQYLKSSKMDNCSTA